MIYFLRHVQTGLIKIGLTRKYFDRHYTLSREYGMLELLGLMDGGFDIEQSLHTRFHHLNVRGQIRGAEWFTPAPELLKYIKVNTSLNFPLPFIVDTGKRYPKVMKGGGYKRHKRAPRNRPGVHNRLWELLKEKELKENRKIRVAELSSGTGISRQTIHYWLRDDVQRFDDNVCEAFLRYFKCRSVNELLYVVREGL